MGLTMRVFRKNRARRWQKRRNLYTPWDDKIIRSWRLGKINCFSSAPIYYSIKAGELQNESRRHDKQQNRAKRREEKYE